MQPISLTAGRLSLRPWSDPDRGHVRQVDADVAALLDGYADPQMARFVSWRVRDPDEALAYLRMRAQEWAAGTRCSWAVVETTDDAPTVSGEVGVKQIDRAAGTAHLAVWTHRRTRGRGIAVQAVRAASDFAFDTLGLTRLAYTHAVSNPASAAVAERAGFRCTGPELPAAAPGHPRADRILWVRAAEPDSAGDSPGAAVG